MKKSKQTDRLQMMFIVFQLLIINLDLLCSLLLGCAVAAEDRKVPHCAVLVAQIFIQSMLLNSFRYLFEIKFHLQYLKYSNIKWVFDCTARAPFSLRLDLIRLVRS